MRALFLAVALAATSFAGQPQPMRDGSSADRAIRLYAHSMRVTFADEWQWIATHFPGARMLSPQQSYRFTRDMSSRDPVVFATDAVAFLTADGTRKTVYFDVTGL